MLFGPARFSHLLLFAGLAVASRVADSALRCRELNFHIAASGLNVDISNYTLDTLLTTPLSAVFSDPTALNFQYPVNGTFDVAARYCEPRQHDHIYEKHPHSDTLQFLVHGATYTRDYWSGLVPPGDPRDANNSWVNYASEKGYPTLTVDRLGNGKSSHPDPQLILQASIQAEIIHRIIQQVRLAASPLRRSFSKVIYVGHSYGSIIGDLVTSRHPTSINALLSAPIIRAVFYSPQNPLTYHPTLFNFDVDTRGTFSIGEIITALFSIVPAPMFQGEALVVTGKYDAIFCAPGAGSQVSDCGNATAGPVAETRALFPAAKSFEAVVLEDAGHCWQNHHVAREGFEAVHAWLERVGY
ncbi:Alpha/Beta hydrolase protein [Amylocarpus encephaloides]|uniref:Alpha/Beta hydrolase protein n=1 Tax=Amylocarpus encephaloides TaxID=45428 RepID=A0A9P7YTV7_9HELO|nr:Alpha/Beta hydrolase protein [Amylocarpus encephaloides]